MDGGNTLSRPEVLANVSETQIEELERQFGEGDRQAWGELTRSYGWSEEESNAAWQWFEQQPAGQQGGGPGVS